MKFEIGFIAALCGLLAFANAGCGKTCGVDNCDGCCDATGACQPGTASDACGAAGGACATCVGVQQCNAISHACTFASSGGNGSGTNGTGNGSTTVTTGGSTNVGTTTGNTTTTTTGTSGTTSTSGCGGASSCTYDVDCGGSYYCASGCCAEDASRICQSGSCFYHGDCGYNYQCNTSSFCCQAGTSTTGTTGANGSGTISGPLAFNVTSALGAASNGFVIFALANQTLTCPMFYGDAGFAPNTEVIAGGVYGVHTGLYAQDDGGVIGADEYATGMSYSDAWYTTAGSTIQVNSVSGTFSGSYAFVLIGDGGMTSASGSFSVPLCP